MYSHCNTPEASPLQSTNELLVLASSLSSVSEIAQSSLRCESRAMVLATATRRVHVFRTLTQLLFVFVERVEGAVTFTPRVFEVIYQHYCEVVVPDPLYTLGMPISSEWFVPYRYF